jgi:DNA repair photolyase
MRWENLGIHVSGSPAPGALSLAMPDAVVRTFDTPDFDGMTFYEVRAKSLISRVPAGARVPFEWTINPYRGCSHACVYCLAGDTEILMADGSQRPLADLRVGDAIYGTTVRGGSRRCVATTVEAHWSTTKAAHRITLADGTALVASADHRFLTDRGWKYVTGSHDHRPYLTLGRRLVGLRYAQEPPGEVGPASSVVSVEPLGVSLPMFDITTGTGDFIANGVVSHNCFARHTHTYLDLDAGHDFDSRVIVKVNAPELLRKELGSARWHGAPVAMGTNVDCYQRAEGRYRLMPGIIEALRDHANPFSILTKGTLITRDLPLLCQAAEMTQVSVSFSIGFIDDDLWRRVEPGTPHPRRRLDAVRRFADAGFAVTVLVAPILPGLTDTDESIDATVSAIAAAGAAGVVPLVLHLRPGAREWYAAWLAREYPHLVARYQEIYGPGSYAPAAYQREISARVRTAARRFGLDRPHRAEHRRPAHRHGVSRGVVGDVVAAHPGPTAPAPAHAERGARDRAEQLSLL